MINIIRGIYKTDHPLAIEAREPSPALILNECRNWIYDESTETFKLIIEKRNGEAEQVKPVCLTDYSFETDLFYIILDKPMRSDPRFRLNIKPIHPNANVATHFIEFIITPEEAEQLSSNPRNIPNIICNEFALTDPFDQNISDILLDIEHKSYRYSYGFGPDPYDKLNQQFNQTIID